MKKKNQFPLFFLLLLSGCLLTGAGYAGKNSIYASYDRKKDWHTPELAVVFQGMKDGVYPWMQFGGSDMNAAVFAMQTGEDLTEPLPEAPSWPEESAPASEAAGQEETEEKEPEKKTAERKDSEENRETDAPETAAAATQEEKEPVFRLQGEDGPGYDRFGNLIKETGEAASVQVLSGPENPSEDDTPGQEEPVPASEEEIPPEQKDPDPVPGKEPMPEQAQEASVPQETGRAYLPGPYPFVTVPAAYFDDALFIGDSRTVGLGEYGGFQKDTTFYAATSLTIYHIFRTPKKVAHLINGKKATVEEALTERQFGKIYIMLGINEIGMGTTESFFTAYADVVNRIRLLQPDAVIYIQGIMRVGGEKSRTDAIFNNEIINERNQALAAMANGENIFYLEVNDAVCDENGDLTADYTFDQIHLKAKYYQLWRDYLFSHGIVRTPAA